MGEFVEKAIGRTLVWNHVEQKPQLWLWCGVICSERYKPYSKGGRTGLTLIFFCMRVMVGLCVEGGSLVAMLSGLWLGFCTQKTQCNDLTHWSFPLMVMSVPRMEPWVFEKREFSVSTLLKPRHPLLARSLGEHSGQGVWTGHVQHYPGQCVWPTHVHWTAGGCVVGFMSDLF